MNNVVLFGRIANDLELKTTTNGKSVCNFNVAINKFNNEGTNFIPCRAWNKTAENLTRYKKKGEQIVLVGSIETYDFEEDNKKRKYVYVSVNQIHYVSISNNQKNNSENKAIEDVANDIFGNGNVSFEEDNEVNISFDDLPFDMQ